MLLLLVSYTMYRNLHKYFIDLLTSYMIQYCSGYDPRFPRKRLWFEFQLGDSLLFLLFSVCFCCFHFDLLFLFLSLIASTICQLLHLGIKSQKAVDILYCVQKFSLSRVHTYHACITEHFLTPRMKFLCSKKFTWY